MKKYNELKYYGSVAKLALQRYSRDIAWWGIVFLLFIIAAFRPVGIDRDSLAYQNAIQHYIETDFKDFDFTLFEPTFYVIILFSKWLFPDPVRGVFVLYAGIALLIKACAVQRILGRSFFALFVYVCLFYFLHEMTQIRAGIAIGIFILSIDDIEKRKPLHYYIKSLIAISFHYSADLMVPLYFMNKRTIIFYFLPVVSVLFTLLVPNEEFIGFLTKCFSILPVMYSAKLIGYLLYHSPNNISLVSLFFTSKIFIFYLLYYYFIILVEKRKIIESIYEYGVIFHNIFSIALCIYFIFIRQRVMALRPAEFLFSVLILLIPWIATKFHNERYRLIYILIMSSVCFIILTVDQILIKKLINIEYILQIIDIL